MNILQENKDALEKIGGHGNALKIYLAIKLRGGKLRATKLDLSNLAVLPIHNHQPRNKYQQANYAITKLIKLGLIEKNGDDYSVLEK